MFLNYYQINHHVILDATASWGASMGILQKTALCQGMCILFFLKTYILTEEAIINSGINLPHKMTQSGTNGNFSDVKSILANSFQQAFLIVVNGV